MIRVILGLVVAMLIGLPLVPADSQTIEPFLGNWQGQAVTSADSELLPEDLRVTVAKTASDIQLSWNDLTLPDRQRIEARFVHTDRQGVFEYAPEAGSFLDRMFAAPSSGNPLQGETLLWARMEADALAVYSLTIDDQGGFDLDHYSWSRTEEGLRLRFRQRTQNLGDELVVEGLLTQAGD